MSITTSAIAAYQSMADEHPELVEYLHRPIHFSRQGEQAPDEAPSYAHPIFDTVDGKLFSKWNRNRVSSAQKIPTAQLSPKHGRVSASTRSRRPDLTHTIGSSRDVRHNSSHDPFEHRLRSTTTRRKKILSIALAGAPR